MRKILIFSVLVLLSINLFQYYYFNNKLNKIKYNNIKNLRQVRDSAHVEIDMLTIKSKKRFDSIINLPPKIKWKKYEKPVYIDRTLDDALRIHSKYKADTRTN